MEQLKGYIPARTDDAAELAAKMERAHEGCYEHALDDERAQPASEPASEPVGEPKPVVEKKPVSEPVVEKKPVAEKKDPRPRGQRVSRILKEETEKCLKSAGGRGRAMIAAAEKVVQDLLGDYSAEELGGLLKRIERFVAEAYTRRPDTSEDQAKKEASCWMSRMLGQPEKRAEYQPPKVTPEEVRAELKRGSIIAQARKVLGHLKRKGARYTEAERIALQDEVRVSLTTRFASLGMSLTEAQRQTANIVDAASNNRPQQYRRSDAPQARDRAVTIIPKPKASEAPPPMVYMMAADTTETPKGERTPEQIAAYHARIAAELAAKAQRRLAQELLEAAKRESKERQAQAMEAARKKRAADKAKAEAAAQAKRERAEAKRAKANKRAERSAHA